MNENDLARGLNQVLQEHQHESGLHMIGGQRRLVDRLLHFIEQKLESGQKTTAEQDRGN